MRHRHTTSILSWLIIIALILPMLITNIEAQSGRNWEEVYRSLPRAELLKDYVQRLAAEPHHVGSAAGRRNAEWMRDQLNRWGLQATIEEYDILFPTPRERVLELLEPARFQAQLKEPALSEDVDSGDADQLPTYNAFSGDGDVTAPLVYVNYGVPADYEQLTKAGIDVKGKIVIARYGGSWRGIKPKLAAERGAVGCLIYSDPRDDGYYQGDVYPVGAYRNEHGVQRGSVMDLPVQPGDPLTPGWASTKDARRLRREEAGTLMKIPVLPISYGDALPLLKALGGPVAPESWRGALPVTYHIGPGSTKVRLKVISDWNIRTARNVIARIPGSTYPDEWIIRGNHHDAWVNGADDPVSGLATVLEEARCFGELLKQGWRPKRTMIFCAWDAEEPGLIGSTEWVEDHAAELREKAVAYINTDSTGKGWFSAGGSHSLERLVNDVARTVRGVEGERTLWEGMQARSRPGARGDSARRRTDLPISALGSGSDYTPFLDHLGIASLNIGMGGESGGGIYHSIYDTFNWYTRFSDGDFRHGRVLTQTAGTLTMRLADAQLLPFEFTNLAETISGYLDEVSLMPRQAVDLQPLREAIERLRIAADDYDRNLRQAATHGRIPAESSKELRDINRLLYQSERRLISEAGLPRRPWFRHQIYAPGYYTGYGVKTLPGVREAIEQRNWDEATLQTGVAVKVIEALSSQIREASTRLVSR
ncbi:MAG: transferrin receptor-like dimerization domain-containing protein [Acidobacteriota bacterium]|jgi:N-acetylated-alpha-linked acidic dipeptidase